MDEHASASPAPSGDHLYLWAACAFTVICATLLVFRRPLRIRPGQLFAVLGIEALVATIYPPPGGYERAAALAAAGILCLAEILIVQESGKRMERESYQRHDEVKTNMVALKETLVAQFQAEALSTRARLETQLDLMRSTASQTGKALITQQLWTLIGHLSNLTQPYFEKAAAAVNIPFMVDFNAYMTESSRRQQDSLDSLNQTLQEYTRAYYNQVVSMRNTLKAKYRIHRKELDDALKPSQSDPWAIATVARVLSQMADKLATANER
ncbi:MAG TPA: hypothetical protein VGI19_02750 [Candidatus Cybelea sp.]|jgi:formiminotetrahydrofolate cyclodeaminase